MPTAWSRGIVAAGLLLGSLAVGLAVGEGVTRLVVDRVDYLMADPVFDSVLGARLPPHTSGHDAWGFRNHAVPEEADVVTIGDSQTYGVGAPGPRAWPVQLGRLTGRRVYSAALGGYSPIQYRELLQRYALPLHPSVVVVGFYLGNDLWEAHRTVYALPHWAALRRPGLPLVHDDGEGQGPDPRFLGSLRNWLAHHSVLYRMATASLLGGLAQRAELAASAGRIDVVVFAPGNGVPSTAFTPAYRLRTVDLDSASIREGLRLSLERLALMAEECRAAGVTLVVALIPTKERVYQPWIEADSVLRQDSTMRRLFREEAEAARQVRAALDRVHVTSVDLVPALRGALRHEAVYPPNQDGHPNAAGQAAIAGAVAAVVTPLLRRPVP